jgi:hypothetical protein
MQTLALGPPAEGSSFYERPAPIRRLWTLLGTRHDILLLDPRRVAKTSVLRRMLQEGATTSTLYCTFEGAADEAGVFAALYAAAATVHPDVASRLKRGALARHAERLLKIGVVGFSVERARGTDDTWRTIAAELLAALAHTGEDWVLLTDELPVFLRRLADEPGGLPRVDALLAWLRACRQAPGVRTRWLFAGSIGLDTLTRRWGLVERIQDLRIEHLGALSEDEAPQFVRWAAGRLDLSLPDGAVAELVRRIGWPIPYHLALGVQALAELSAPNAPDAVDAALAVLLHRSRRKDFATWDERLARQLSAEDAVLARALLARACVSPEGCSTPHARAALRRSQDIPAFDERFVFVTDVLQADGYLVEEGTRLQFRSPLLREWWARHARGR